MLIYNWLMMMMWLSQIDSSHSIFFFTWDNWNENADFFLTDFKTIYFWTIQIDFAYILMSFFKKKSVVFTFLSLAQFSFFFFFLTDTWPPNMSECDCYDGFPLFQIDLSSQLFMDGTRYAAQQKYAKCYIRDCK